MGLAVGLNVVFKLLGLVDGLAVGDRLGQVVTAHQGPAESVGLFLLAHPDL